MLHRLLFALLVPLVALTAGEPLATFEKNSVAVVLTYEAGEAPGTGTLVGLFTPKPTKDPLHLYSVDLKGEDAGVATTIAVRPGQSVAAAGPLTADKATHDLEGLAVYPDGPVTVRLPLTVPPSADGAPVETTLLISYMACSAKFCLNPVIKTPVKVLIPTARAGGAAQVPTPGGLDAVAVRQIVSGALATHKDELLHEVRKLVVAEIDRLHEQSASAVRWRHPASIAEAERLIDEAKKAGKPALLDFTGPSCVNCQLMDKTVFRVPAVAAAWNRGVPISINTDPDPRVSDDFSAWQQKTFQTQNRPLYVHIAPDGKETRWSEVFPPSDRATLALFVAFAEGGVGSDGGSGDGIAEFLLLAILGGLFTLLMPCTYPMIPFTMTFFAKQAANGMRLLPLAAFYSLGIIACFVGLGVLITGVFGSTLSTLAGHPVTNLVIALLFLVLGLGLLGAFLIRLPAGLENSLGGGRGGYLGALIMGLTFAITAFSCTAPFAGAVLSQAVVTGSWTRAMVGMAVYASAIAVPFFALAMSPGLLKKLPKAGSWMNEFKVVGGLVELAAALKFLVICDVAWEWGLIGRSFTLASWSAVSLVIGVYVLGKLRFSSDEPVEQVGVGRLLIALTFIALGIWLASGLAGNNLGLFESFFPGDEVPGA